MIFQINLFRFDLDFSQNQHFCNVLRSDSHKSWFQEDPSIYRVIILKKIQILFNIFDPNLILNNSN